MPSAVQAAYRATPVQQFRLHANCDSIPEAHLGDASVPVTPSIVKRCLVLPALRILSYQQLCGPSQKTARTG